MTEKTPVGSRASFSLQTAISIEDEKPKRNGASHRFFDIPAASAVPLTTGVSDATAASAVPLTTGFSDATAASAVPLTTGVSDATAASAVPLTSNLLM